jgi:cellulose synthase/poly-beta-1,6-N-acetylglucosamine synthase-like glycosyltransferase
METLPIIYLGYMFISIYFLSLFLSLYLKNRKELFDYPETKKKYTISVLVPAYNEEKTIENTIKSIFSSAYSVKELIVLNDGSKDDTGKIVKKLLKKYPALKLINKENSGKGDSLNQGLKIAKGELVAVVDADSYPANNSFGKMIGFFDDSSVGAATCVFVPRNRNNFLEKLQVIEYNVIAFTRKLLGYVDAIYVTPGPLALYRKSALEKIGGFSTKNMTEDIEATWHLAYEGYKRKMCLATYATTTVPNKFKPWYKQRRRWNIGGLQCISQYKGCFLKKGMLGFFILPFFVMQLFLGLIGLTIFFYLITTRIISNYIFAKYSIDVGTPLVTMNDFFITPSFLNYLGVILFIAGTVFTIMLLVVMKEKILRKQNIFNMFFYFIFYLSIYPFIMIAAIYHFFKGTGTWR